MRTIQLTQGQVALVDDEDFEELSRFKWFAQWDRESRTYYARRQVRHEDGRQRAISMHRAVTGADPHQKVDHINHNGLDNRRGNLRTCTSSQNLRNMRKRGGCSSRYKGVYYADDTGRWRAYITEPRASGIGRRRHLGYFNSEQDAAGAYDRAARELFGEFALLNGVS